jgi:hypothetical protein
VDCEPCTALVPDHAPDAVQAVALVADQFNVALPPLATALGPTLRLTVGTGDLMETVADWAALPPGPEQLSLKVASEERTPVDCEPLTALLPDQAPDAEHDVAFAALQLSVELVPFAIVLGLALILTVGAGEVTETVADCVARLPAPVQVKVNVAFAVSEPEDCEPLKALLPDHEPEAEHAVAFLVDQVTVEAAPELTVLGLALSVTTGGNPETVTVADCVADPPDPVQVNTYSVVLESAPVDHVPFVATAPLQPSEAVHAVAFSDFQLRLDMPPLTTVAGEAARVTVGAGEVTTTSADCEADPPGPVQVSV